MKEEKKINVDDLNGVDFANYKLITLTIQDFNPISFSEQCEKALKTINPEIMVNYSTSVINQSTNRGNAIIFICIVQFWDNHENYTNWINEIKRNNLIIKP